MARKKLQDTRLTARMSGMLARRGIEPGEQTAPGYPVFTIAQIDPVLLALAGSDGPLDEHVGAQ